MIIIMQNDPQVPPGLLLDVFHATGAPFKVVRTFDGDRVSISRHVSALVVLGGYMSVYDTAGFPFLGYVGECIRDALTRELPFLGICLGGQLLSKVLGGEVHLGTNGEQGCHVVSLTGEGERDALFRGMPREFVSFQWHHDSFELPPGGIHLAGSAACPYQAFRYAKRAYGLQFHPEVDREIVLEWSNPAGSRQAEVMAAFLDVEAEYRSHSLTLFKNFLRLTGGDSLP